MGVESSFFSDLILSFTIQAVDKYETIFILEG